VSHNLNLQLSDDVFRALAQEASVTGATPAQVAIRSLEGRFGQKNDLRSETEKHAAKMQFESHFGEIDLGKPMDLDNDRIDADLARQYADNHEDA
jgi:hypothetical protein